MRAAVVDSPRTVFRIKAEFDRLPNVPVGSGVVCPKNDGTEIWAYANYKDGRSVTVALALTGCELVRNGSLTRSALGIPQWDPQHNGLRLADELERLTALPAHLTGIVARSEGVRPAPRLR